jgi:hypothetical protein
MEGKDLKTFSLLTAGLALWAAGGVAQAGIVLDGASLLTIDPATGAYSANGIFSTTGCCDGLNVYVGSIGSLGSALSLSTGLAPDTYPDLAYTLPNGTTSFVLEGTVIWGAINGTDLFFNMPFGTGNVGSQGPSITAYLDGSNNLASGSASNTQPNWVLSIANLPNGGLSFSGGGQTVTLSNYASGFDPNNSLDYASFDLTVTSAGSVPEPGTVLLFGAGLAAIGLVRRRAKVRG